MCSLCFYCPQLTNRWASSRNSSGRRQCLMRTLRTLKIISGDKIRKERQNLSGTSKAHSGAPGCASITAFQAYSGFWKMPSSAFCSRLHWMSCRLRAYRQGALGCRLKLDRENGQDFIRQAIISCLHTTASCRYESAPYCRIDPLGHPRRGSTSSLTKQAQKTTSL